MTTGGERIDGPIGENATLRTQTIDRLVPPTPYTVDYLESWYPERNLPEGAKVTRIAPSPTGSMHIGGLYAALISERVAHQSGGVFFLRIEDTDKNREQTGAVGTIVKSMQTFGIHYDEGIDTAGQWGSYGPYVQSQRSDIYQTYVRGMLEKGLAYPCFMTAEELLQVSARQEQSGIRTGLYGQWAEWRDQPDETVNAALDEGRPYVIRFRSEGDIGRSRVVHDVVRGTRSLPETDNDIVLLKTNGMPTYHLAHVVDDHLMHTTTVIRGDEWLSSLTLHLQLAEALDIEPPEYGHIAPIQKLTENGGRRELSKRNDPEASVGFYQEQGYPPAAVVEYLLNQANSDFENWRRANPDSDYRDYYFSLASLPKNSGALLNLDKLNDVSQNYLGGLDVAALTGLMTEWALQYDRQFAGVLSKDPSYTARVLSVERNGNKSRKDLVTLSQSRDVYGFFYDELFELDMNALESNEQFSRLNAGDMAVIIEDFIRTYQESDTRDVWFDKVKEIGSRLGFTPNMKEYRKNPADFKGSVADVAMVLRIALTGRNRSPDLHEVMGIMGRERVVTRLQHLKALITSQ